MRRIEHGLDDRGPGQSVGGHQQERGSGRAPALDGHDQCDVQRYRGEQEGGRVLDRVQRGVDGEHGPGALHDDRDRPHRQQQAEGGKGPRAVGSSPAGQHQQAQPGGQDQGHAVSGYFQRQRHARETPWAGQRSDPTPRPPHLARPT